MSGEPPEGSRLQDLLAIMQRLRSPEGCAWDRRQNFATIAPYTLEEAYEVIDAIERSDMGGLESELGDLLLQVVFHAQMASEAGLFDFESVADGICRKLIRRHPHVFGDGDGDGDGNGPGLPAVRPEDAWEDIKALERRGETDRSLLAGVPSSMPALLRAYKLSARAARAGFDFDLVAQTADKVAEELAEVREAANRDGAAGNPARPDGDNARADVFEEVGDLLFAAANLARKLEVDAEAALRAANIKFERRFRAMEALASARGETFEDLELTAQEGLWQAVKRGE